jgi:Na+/melibiose symporter-like transporter
MTATSAQTFTWQDGWRYGLMGLPLAFVALPLYVLLPNHYARNFGVSLSTLGALLLAVRLFDAVIDPWLGRTTDRLFSHTPAAVLRWGALAAVALCLGFALLFFPPDGWSGNTDMRLRVWLSASLLLTTVGYSALSVLHQAWGARLGGDEAKRSRVVAWREGLGLAGVVLASISPLLIGLSATVALLFIASGLAWLGWCAAPAPLPAPAGYDPARPSSMCLPWSRPGFRSLMAVFLVNGIASAVPATLILFFVQDRLQAPAAMEPVFLGSYFVCAALALPLWLKVVNRLGLALTWALGMTLALLVFAFAAQLEAGDSAAFVLVCALSGVAMGTDLTLPAALLNGRIEANGDRGQAEGAYFGWWAFTTKLTLALAAGLALPLLSWWGYTPGARGADALQTLTWAYCLLPCVLKALALALLYFFIIRKIP